MKKRRGRDVSHRILLLAAGALLFLSACGDGEGAALSGGPAPTPGPDDVLSQDEGSPAPAEGYTVTAMYVPLGTKDPPEVYLLFDQKDDSAFTLGDLPEDIRDRSGSPITWADLNRGDLLEIDFGPDSETMEIYPAVCHGAVRIRVAAEGKPENADRYQSQTDAFYDPQPQVPPILQLSYEEMFLENAVSCGLSLSAARYEWHYEDLEGASQVSSAEKPPALLREDLEEVKLYEPLSMTLSVFESPADWAVVRWEEKYLGAENAPEGEPVELEEGENGGRILPGAEPGWVYQVTASWDESWVEYAFLIRQASPPKLDSRGTASSPSSS